MTATIFLFVRFPGKWLSCHKLTPIAFHKTIVLFSNMTTKKNIFADEEIEKQFSFSKKILNVKKRHSKLRAKNIQKFPPKNRVQSFRNSKIMSFSVSCFKKSRYNNLPIFDISGPVNTYSLCSVEVLLYGQLHIAQVIKSSINAY